MRDDFIWKIEVKSKRTCITVKFDATIDSTRLLYVYESKIFIDEKRTIGKFSISSYSAFGAQYVESRSYLQNWGQKVRRTEAEQKGSTRSQLLRKIRDRADGGNNED